MRPMKRFKSAVAEDMLSAAASIGLSALPPRWSAVLSILPATAIWTLAQCAGLLRIQHRGNRLYRRRYCPRLSVRSFHVGKARFGERCRLRIRHRPKNCHWTYLVGQHRFETTGAMPYTYQTRNCWISEGQVPKTPYVAFRRRHTQGICGLVSIGDGRARIFGLTFGLC